MLPMLAVQALRAPWGAWMPCCAKLHLGSSTASVLHHHHCLATWSLLSLNMPSGT